MTHIGISIRSGSPDIGISIHSGSSDTASKKENNRELIQTLEVSMYGGERFIYPCMCTYTHTHISQKWIISNESSIEENCLDRFIAVSYIM